MEKVKAFTLIELILVVIIIWIVAASLTKAKRNTSWDVDIWRDAVNIIHKELDQYLKDFQRNKIWEDASGNVHEIDYFKLILSGTANTGTEITVWNYYSGDNYVYFDSWTLIQNKKYAAFQYLKWVEKYTFYIYNKWNITPIRITNNWKIYTWTAENPNNNELQHSEYQFLIDWWKWWKIEHIWAITINAVTKESRLDRCETEKYTGINCSEIIEN